MSTRAVQLNLKAGSGSPVPSRRIADGRLACRLGVAHAVSPDAPFRHPAFRSLGGNLAFAILAALGFLRRSIGMGDPSRSNGKGEVPLAD
jgi:hypothetical protein